MKFSELKKVFRHKYVIRIVAGVLIVSMAGTGVAAYGAERKNAVLPETVIVAEKEEDTSEEAENELRDALSSSIKLNEVEIGKEETVYLIADSTGKTEQTIVSEHLINNEDRAVLEDASTLTEIQNVKGEETFTRNGTKLSWQADGNDIFYQGTTEKEAPVTEQLTYYLNGKEISPENLAGKSGKVTIRFDYTNQEKVTTKINGENTEVCVPFVAVSGMVLDDSFQNIEVTNGKVMADGSKNVVIGYVLPGLKESLAVEDEDFDTELHIPDYFEVTAEVEDFSLDMTMTVVMNATNFVGTEGENDLSSLDDLIETLKDAAGQLEDGSGELAEGLDTLQSKLGEFTEGIRTLKDGITDYTSGASQVADGIGTLKKSTPQLSDGITKLGTGISAIYDNFGSTDNQSTIRGGANSLFAGASELSTGADTLSAGAAGVSDGATAVDGAAGQLSAGAESLAAGAAELAAGVDTLVAQVNGMSGKMTEAVASLSNTKASLLSQCGVSSEEELSALIAQAEEGMSNLLAGMQQIEAAYDAAPEETKAVLKNQYEGYMAQYSSLAANVSSLKKAQGAVETIDLVLGEFGTIDLSGTSEQLVALTNGAAGVAAGATQVSGGLKQLKAGTTSLAVGASQVSGGADSLKNGAAALKAGAEGLHSGIEQLYSLAIAPVNEGMNQLRGNIPTLLRGVDQLNAGAAELVSNNTALTDGAAQISEATSQLADGVVQLNDGAHQLADGIVNFHESGINQIVNAYQGDVGPLLKRIQAVLDAGADYQSFTDLADDVNGSVKFIYKTEAVR